jgi:hypothetical protein
VVEIEYRYRSRHGADCPLRAPPLPSGGLSGTPSGAPDLTPPQLTHT